MKNKLLIAIILLIGLQSCRRQNLPESNFSASSQSIISGDEVDFTDLSTNEPTEWSWKFEEGNPSTSKERHPSGIIYDIPGTYDVSLVASNVEGSALETKSGYITVNAKKNSPVVDFMASSTRITAGEAIDFADLSSKNPHKWEWSFEGATPASSNSKNPTGIMYRKRGTYKVTLNASNENGLGSLTKTEYIAVGESILERMRVASKALAIKSSGTQSPPCGAWGWELWANVIATKSNMIPFTIHSENSTSENYVNEEGNALDDYLENTSWPGFYASGAESDFKKLTPPVNPTLFSLTQEFKDNIDDATTKRPLAIAALNWEVNDGSISVTSFVGFLEETSGDFYVSVWLSEDDVYGFQSGHPDGYVYHKNVLRTATDNHSVFGVSIASGTINANTVKITNHTAEFDSLWEEENINVAVIIWRKVGSKYSVINVSDEIYQP